MQNILTQLTTALILILFTASCENTFGPKVKGSGHIVSEERITGDFDEIILDGSYDVELIKGTENSVLIESDDNIIPFLLSRVQDGELKMYSQHNLKPSDRIKLWITVQDVESLTIRGSAEVISDEELVGEFLNLDLSGSGTVRLKINYEEFNARISGSGKFYVEGSVDTQTISISGSGAYHASQLYSREARSTISGSGRMYLMAEEFLKASISGSGTIYIMVLPRWRPASVGQEKL